MLGLVLGGEALRLGRMTPLERPNIYARNSEPPQERGERVHRQMAGVGGGLRQATDFANQLFPAHLPRFFDSLAFDQLSDG